MKLSDELVYCQHCNCMIDLEDFECGAEGADQEPDTLCKFFDDDQYEEDVWIE